MRSILKLTLLAAAGAATLAAGPAMAQKTRHTATQPAAYQTEPAIQGDPNTAYREGDPTVVTVDGSYIGRDPDPRIRSDLIKNQSDHEGNSY